jgi:hypothetical protein
MRMTAVLAPGPTCHGSQLLPQGQVLQDQLPMAAERQRPRAGDHDEQLQHASMVAGIDATFKRGRVLARVKRSQTDCGAHYPARDAILHSQRSAISGSTFAARRAGK